MAGFSVIYIHGFASSPSSGKARYFQQKFTDLGIPIQVPDLNQGDFTHLTLTRQMQQIASILTPAPTVLIGSSFGGLTAALLAENHPQISHIILLAPAFGMATYWQEKMTPAQLQQWQHQGTLPIYHYGEGKELPLHYDFLLDLRSYDDGKLVRPVPTLIIHGKSDDVVPICVSQTYAQSRPWVRLIMQEDDHSLKRDLPLIWQEIGAFLGLASTQN
ncbi:Putative hydrolases or acyltransferases (alpha/beta hydrolase superfamily) [Gloeomargarita lithophora Alchichica-D10]|uniref:Hydrolases or acyltransferases (Alpha/beta hydrolase superfamily) n=1 Tax=Gloeomargarita lithophora Alchichica-D10 TaxID=1188229 RepID=A0A1J0A9A5_9CYAN|nr:YqiA/YcfP family alpha/beta fold hydrolase [Gloeomargarita lithophora]APB32503.1 Putative hydrolases or acyltransferases (alpha/beta hydrolase superfamily) [Gloeomargarita lithophora Alchichica-D10]